MDKKDWRWLPHPAHFICAERCQFVLATEVGGYLVSTVGEFVSNPIKVGQFEEIGFNRRYETMVYKSLKSENLCCEYEADISSGDLDMNGYNSAKAAYQGHIALCNKWSKHDQQTDDN